MGLGQVHQPLTGGVRCWAIKYETRANELHSASREAVLRGGEELWVKSLGSRYCSIFPEKQCQHCGKHTVTSGMINEL